MTTSARMKSKHSTLSKLLSDQASPKVPHKSKKPSSIISDRLESRSSHQQAFSILDSKSLNIYFQLPSPSSQSISKTYTKGKIKKEAHIKGYKSKTNLKSPKNASKSKKPSTHKPNEPVLEFRDKEERLSSEKLLKKSMAFEVELKKALDENKRLKKIIHDEKQNEDLIEDLMKSLKSRLYKYLYE